MMRAAQRARRDPIDPRWVAPHHRGSSVLTGSAASGIYLMVKCEFCGAPEGNWCISPTGARVAWHRSRTRAASLFGSTLRVIAAGVR